MPRHLILRLEGPLQAWGDVAMDPRRPTRDFPSRSALAGLLSNALGWQHMDGERINALQDALRYAVREDRRPQRIIDYQTADLDTEHRGWTRWGVETRGSGTQLLWKHFLADGCLRVALTLEPDGKAGIPSLDELADALLRPARPLFLGRKGCPPATQIFERWVEAESPRVALDPQRLEPVEGASGMLRCWYAADDAFCAQESGATALHEVWDRRDYTTQRFAGSRAVVEGRIEADMEATV